MNKYTRRDYPEVQIAYLAGIIDGEGCVYIGNHSFNKKTGDKYFQTIIKVSTVDAVLSDWLFKTFGGLKGIYTPRQTPKNSKSKIFYWQCSGELLTHLCELMLPFLIIKKCEVEIMLKMRSTFQGTSQKGKQGIQRNTPELLAYREQLMKDLRALHIRNYANKI